MNIGGVRFDSVDGKGEVSSLTRSMLFGKIIAVRTRCPVPIGNVEDGSISTSEDERVEGYGLCCLTKRTSTGSPGLSKIQTGDCPGSSQEFERPMHRRHEVRATCSCQPSVFRAIRRCHCLVE